MGVKLNPFTGKLDVVDSPSGDFSTVELNLGTEGSPSIAFDSDSNTGIYSPGADQVAISTGGSGRLFVDANGHVGINEASPSTYSAGAGVPGFVLKGNSGSHADRSGGLTLVSQDGTTAKTWIYHDTDLFIQSTEATNTRFYTNNSPRLYITSTGELKHIGGGTEGSPGVYFAGSAPSNSLYVQATTGKVGLGTSSPATDLHLSNTTGPVFRIGASGGVANAASTGRIEFYGGSTAGNGPGIKAVIDTESTTGTARDFDLLFKTSPNVGSGEPLERLRIAANGNVGIGTTPSASLHIETATVETEIRLTTTGGNIKLRGSNDDLIVNADQHLFNNEDNTSEYARIDSDGRLLVGTPSAIADNTQALLQISHASGPLVVLGRDDTTVTNGNLIGDVKWFSNAGSANEEVARIRVEADADQGSGDKPGRLTFATTADGASSPTERMRITSDAYVRLASGSGGIQFNGDTAAANALDDYEEGTHVATVTPGTSGTVTLNSTGNTLSYVKIGRFVNVGGYLAVSAVSSPVGYFDISLPFAVANLTFASNTHSVSVHVRRVVAANVTDFVGTTFENGSSVRVVLGDGTNTSDDSAEELQATSWIYVNASYTTS